MNESNRLITVKIRKDKKQQFRSRKMTSKIDYKNIVTYNNWLSSKMHFNALIQNSQQNQQTAPYKNILTNPYKMNSQRLFVAVGCISTHV